MSLTLSHDELIDLTGCKQHVKQAAWLRKNGIRHYIRRDGHVRVVRDDLAQRQPQAGSAKQPNFAALEARS